MRLRLQVLQILKQLLQILKVEGDLLSGVTHPRRYGLPAVLFECSAEGAVAAVPALGCQLLSGKRALLGHCLPVQANEMADAKTVDVCVIS